MKLLLVCSNADFHSILEAITLSMLFVVIQIQELLCYPEKASPSLLHPPYPIVLTIWPEVYSTYNPPYLWN